MKTLLVVMLLSLSSASYAWDTSKNPDAVPSLGLTYHSQTVSGGYGPTLTSDTYLNLGEREYDQQMVTFDTRIPVSNRFTLNLSLSAIELEETFNSNNTDIALNDLSDMDGGAFSLGVRYYFVK